MGLGNGALVAAGEGGGGGGSSSATERVGEGSGGLVDLLLFEFWLMFSFTFGFVSAGVSPVSGVGDVFVLAFVSAD